MKQHLDLMDRILTKGRRKVDRTGVGTYSLFGPQLEFDLSEGFPLPTTRKIFIRGVLEELMWFLNGHTDNELLVAKDVHIWDKWALAQDAQVVEEINYGDRIAMYASKKKIGYQSADFEMRALGSVEKAVKFLDDQQIPVTRIKRVVKKGECGPIYGAMWRKWPNPDGTTTDQIEELLKFLGSENPKQRYSRRLVVSGWNPSLLPDEGASHEENILNGRQVLPPCHTAFQFIVEPLTHEERVSHLEKTYSTNGKNEYLAIYANAAHELGQEVSNYEIEVKALELAKVPKDMLSCKLFARSQDVPVGTVFNIASYSAMVLMLAKQFNMVPGRYIHSMGDAHIYTNQVEQVKEQLSRAPRTLPTMRLVDAPGRFFDYTPKNFVLEGYDPHPKIDYPIAV